MNPSNPKTKQRDRVNPEWIKQQREQGWPDMHPEDYCHRCGKPNKSWCAHPQQVWLDGTRAWAAETGREGICCIDCFTTMYEQNTGTRPIWMLTIFDPSVAVTENRRLESELSQARAAIKWLSTLAEKHSLDCIALENELAYQAAARVAEGGERGA